MIELNGKELAVWFGILSVLGGFLAWVFTKLLDDRKDKLAMKYEIDRLSNELKKMEYIHKLVNEHESQINVLIEKTKKL